MLFTYLFMCVHCLLQCVRSRYYDFENFELLTKCASKCSTSLFRPMSLLKMVSFLNGSADINDFKLILFHTTSFNRPCMIHKNIPCVFLDSECLNDFFAVFATIEIKALLIAQRLKFLIKQF